MGGWGDGESTLVGRLPQYERSGVSEASPKEIPVHAERAAQGGMGRQGDKRITFSAITSLLQDHS